MEQCYLSLTVLLCLAAGYETGAVAESALVVRVAILTAVVTEGADTVADTVAVAASKDSFAEAAAVDSVTMVLVV